MLTLRKVVFRSFVFGSLALFGAVTLQMFLAASEQGRSGASSSAISGFADTAISRVDSATSSISAGLPYQMKSFPHQAALFFRSNATTARLQFEGMKNAVTSHMSLAAWTGHKAPNWIQSPAQMAQAGGSEAHALAQKVPVVTSAMDATRNRVNAVTRSVTNSNLGF